MFSLFSTRMLILSTLTSCGWIGHFVRQRCPGHVPSRPAVGCAYPRHWQADCSHCLRWLLRCLLRHPPAEVLHYPSEAHIPYSRRHCKSPDGVTSRTFLNSYFCLGIHHPFAPSRQSRSHCSKEEVHRPALVVRRCICLQGPHRICSWYRESLLTSMFATATDVFYLAL